ncbi:hypothetical protein ACQJBY_036236 [Aegilops geniculata]
MAAVAGAGPRRVTHATRVVAATALAAAAPRGHGDAGWATAALAVAPASPPPPRSGHNGRPRPSPRPPPPPFPGSSSCRCWRLHRPTPGLQSRRRACRFSKCRSRPRRPSFRPGWPGRHHRQSTPWPRTSRRPPCRTTGPSAPRVSTLASMGHRFPADHLCTSDQRHPLRCFVPPSRTLTAVMLRHRRASPSSPSPPRRRGPPQLAQPVRAVFPGATDARVGPHLARLLSPPRRRTDVVLRPRAGRGRHAPMGVFSRVLPPSIRTTDTWEPAGRVGPPSLHLYGAGLHRPLLGPGVPRVRRDGSPAGRTLRRRSARYIRMDVELQGPQDLQTAMYYARAFERRAVAIQQASPSRAAGPPPWPDVPAQGRPAQASAAPLAATAARPFRRLTSAELFERRRQGLCFNCDETYMPGHVCPRLFSTWRLQTTLRRTPSPPGSATWPPQLSRRCLTLVDHLEEFSKRFPALQLELFVQAGRSVMTGILGGLWPKLPYCY